MFNLFDEENKVIFVLIDGQVPSLIHNFQITPKYTHKHYYKVIIIRTYHWLRCDGNLHVDGLPDESVKHAVFISLNLVSILFLYSNRGSPKVPTHC